MDFSSLVWSIPMLLLFAMLLGFTLNHNNMTTKVNIGFAFLSFVLALCVIIERIVLREQDYGYYLDWFVVDNFYYRIGYELNDTASYFLVIVTAINVILHIVNKLIGKEGHKGAYACLNLIFGLITGIILADNVLTYYILSFCTSVALFLYLASNNDNGQILVIRKYVKTFITGHLLFLCALLLIFYHQPNHAVEFTVIDSSIKMQPDLLSIDHEWIIGLLLIVSSIFTSTIIAPLERHFSTLSNKHIVLVYVLMSVRIILPAYLLIRFESLIRIDERIESVVLILGTAILIYTAINVIKERTTTQRLLTMSNAMLGLLYIMFGLQAKLMLSACVLIYILVQISLIVLVHFVNKKVMFNVLKLGISVVLFLPFVICISLSKHYALYDSMLTTILNVTTWLGMVTYSFIIISCLYSFKLKQARESFNVLKHGYIVSVAIVLITLFTIAPSGHLWWSEFVADERSEFMNTLNRQIWLNLLTVCIQVSLGLLFVFIKQRFLVHKVSKKNKATTVTADRSSIVITIVKTFVLKAVGLFELWWVALWDKTIPYLFKRSEGYIAIKQPRFVVRLILVWSVATLLSILLVIIRR